MRVVEKTLSLGYKLSIFIVTFLVVVYLLISSKIWSADLNQYFIRTGKWPELVFMILVVYIISQVLEKMLRWQFRVLARVRR
jgi:hypothetical protein